MLSEFSYRARFGGDSLWDALLYFNPNWDGMMSWDEWYYVLGAIAESVDKWGSCQFKFDVIDGRRGYQGSGYVGDAIR